jgi:hypothetical protein
MRNLQGDRGRLTHHTNKPESPSNGTLMNPFKSFWAILTLMFKLGGYTLTFLIQVLAFSALGNRDGITEAFGWYGRSVTDALAKCLE